MQQPFIKISDNEFGDVQFKYIDSNCEELQEEFQIIYLAKNDLPNIAKAILSYCEQEGITHE
ncbi:MAG: hypothetical protein Unbinned4466contig1000_44 [Prokaryotic dsDNA virus sp.]|nr:MAG: hypothetical protein Unbinned4466contig1000_44 [Prokaryotic dsDNA virus sp.]|tara:strand:+ start:11037 stop:11222 length:186 start_codon:yes stop_codon:yes gene_type:complete